MKLASLIGTVLLLAMLERSTAFTYLCDIDYVSRTTSSAQCPSGYQKDPTNVNRGAGGKYIYLCYKWCTATGYLTRNPGYVYHLSFSVTSSATERVCTTGGIGLNEGTSGKYILICLGKQSFSKASSMKDFILGAEVMSFLAAITGAADGKHSFIPTNLNEGNGGDALLLTVKYGADEPINPEFLATSPAPPTFSPTRAPPTPAPPAPTPVPNNVEFTQPFQYLCRKIQVVYSTNGRSPSCPSGFIKDETNLNLGAGGAIMHFCYKLCTAQPEGGNTNAITSISYATTTSATDRLECTAGYEDLNLGANSDHYVYLCYASLGFARIEDLSQLITDFKVVHGSTLAEARSNVPEGYSYDSTNLNLGAGGQYILTAWRRAAPMLAFLPTPPTTVTLKWKPFLPPFFSLAVSTPSTFVTTNKYFVVSYKVRFSFFVLYSSVCYFEVRKGSGGSTDTCAFPWGRFTVEWNWSEN